jgi:hypothetical protein
MFILFIGCSDKKKSNDTQTIESIDTFNLSSQNIVQKVTIANKKVIFRDIEEAVVVINISIFPCNSCLVESQYLTMLQNRYKDEVFVISVMANNNIGDNNITNFKDKYGLDYFISTSNDNSSFTKLLVKNLNIDKDFNLPLTVIYKEGKYFNHYNGLAPIEMIEFDIKQALKVLN